MSANTIYELSIIAKMTASTLCCVLLAYFLWKILNGRGMTMSTRILVGVLFGLFSIFSTHFGIDYSLMVINVRNLGPMAAGLFFDPLSGIIAGLIGGVERYIVGRYFDIGSFTTLACSISTCMSGFFAAFLRIFVFKRKNPPPETAFLMGSVAEVFHMYAVFITHPEDVNMAFAIVKTCSLKMIFFGGLGLDLIALALKIAKEGWRNTFKRLPRSEQPVSRKFHQWLFFVAMGVLMVSFVFYYAIQTRMAEEDVEIAIDNAESYIEYTYELFRKKNIDYSEMSISIEYGGMYGIYDQSGARISGYIGDDGKNRELFQIIKDQKEGKYFRAHFWGEKWLCKTKSLSGNKKLIILIPEYNMYLDRDIQAYETFLADILTLTAVFMIISMLVESTVIDNLKKVTESLNRITEGNLNETVNVYASQEFTSLSNDINETVDVLKGYIDAAEKRMEEELALARTIQESALPKNFDFNHHSFEIYATMHPARDVGGDFYDFFFIDSSRLALVIADVSGKGIPAALYMMRSKTALHGLAEVGADLPDVFARTNEALCQGNDADMFVTVWMGIVDLDSGLIKCVNAGHEYPAIRHSGGDFELLKKKHGPPLGVMEGLKFTEYEIVLEPGDTLFVYTDGVPEAINKAKEQYGTDRMLAALNKAGNCSMRKLLPAVRYDLNLFVGDEDQFDDVTMLGFFYRGSKD